MPIDLSAVSSVLSLACLPVFFWSPFSSQCCLESEFPLVTDVFSLGHIQGHLSLAAVRSLTVKPGDKAIDKSSELEMRQTARASLDTDMPLVLSLCSARCHKLVNA